jgi:dihydrofolate reductase (trimethoprim resistance protein)
MTDLDPQALNNATWMFIAAWRKHTDIEIPGVVWNNSKHMVRAAIETYLEQTCLPTTHTKFALGDAVEKTKGASWHGQVVGWYNTDLTPEGYCVESFREPGSVQIYPAAALRRVYEPDLECFRDEDPAL